MLQKRWRLWIYTKHLVRFLIIQAVGRGLLWFLTSFKTPRCNWVLLLNSWQTTRQTSFSQHQLLGQNIVIISCEWLSGRRKEEEVKPYKSCLQVTRSDATWDKSMQERVTKKRKTSVRGGEKAHTPKLLNKGCIKWQIFCQIYHDYNILWQKKNKNARWTKQCEEICFGSYTWEQLWHLLHPKIFTSSFAHSLTICKTSLMSVFLLQLTERQNKTKQKNRPRQR